MTRSGLDVLGALIGNGQAVEGFEGFDTPVLPPQFDGPPEEGKTIRELLEEAPQMHPDFCAELEHLIRTSIPVRAAIAHSMAVARDSELALRHADNMNDVARAQGAVQGLERYYVGIITMLETPPPDASEKDEEDVEDEEFPI